MNAQEAREALKAGKKIRRSHWIKKSYIYFDITKNHLVDEFNAARTIYVEAYDNWELYEDPNLTLREGGTYVARNGEITESLRENKEFGKGNVFEVYYKDGFTSLNNGNGKCCQDMPEWDLIQEITEAKPDIEPKKPLVMREGAYYKTRDGRITEKGLEKNFSITCDLYPWVAIIEGSHYFYTNGGNYLSGGFLSSMDLVEELPAPAKPEVSESHTEESDISYAVRTSAANAMTIKSLQYQINKLSYASGLTAGKLDKHLAESSKSEPETGDFAYALKLMREGKMVRRTSWNNKDYCIYFDGIPPMSSDPIILYDSNIVTKVLYPIHLSDFTATDWEEHKEGEI